MTTGQRTPLIAGNWKMNKSIAEAKDLAEGIKLDLAECREVDVVLCPPFTALQTVGEVVGETLIKLGAQNMHWEPEGAYTGEISPRMLRDIYCHYVILGHSERRQYFQESDQFVNHKLKVALEYGLKPILCVGETLEQRGEGRQKTVVSMQVERGLSEISAEAMKDVAVAYEPIWAIGTGRTATPEQAQEAHAFIRKTLGEMFDPATAAKVRIQYGGSIKPDNAKELLHQPDIDGALVGGASLDPRSFAKIVQAAARS